MKKEGKGKGKKGGEGEKERKNIVYFRNKLIYNDLEISVYFRENVKFKELRR